MDNSPIKKARILRGLTQAELAGQLGMSPQQLSAYEGGRRNPGPKVLPILARALNVEESYLRGEAAKLPVYNYADRSLSICSILYSEEVPGYGMFYLVDFPAEFYLVIAVIVTGDSLQFTTDDWQGRQPESAREIPDFEWVDSQGVDALMLNNLPRSLCIHADVVHA